jgi:MFS family permease
VRYHHLSLTSASLITSLLGIGAVAGALTGGFAGDRLVAQGVVAGRYYVAGIADLLAVALLVPAFATGSLKLMVVPFALGATMITMPTPQLSAVLADVVHPDLRGRTSAATSLVSALSTAASPLTFGLLSDRLGLRSAFLILLPLMGIGGAFLLLLGPRFLSADIKRMRAHLSGASTAFADSPAVAGRPMPGHDNDPEARLAEADDLPQRHQAAKDHQISVLAIAFGLLCLLGIVAALGLAVTEASR